MAQDPESPSVGAPPALVDAYWDADWDADLTDLAHDLARHAALPVRLLPPEAPADVVRAAILVGLRQTRRGPQGVVAARELWAAFRVNARPSWQRRAQTVALESAVERLLAWEARLAEEPGAGERTAWLRACDDVAVAIGAAREVR